MNRLSNQSIVLKPAAEQDKIYLGISFFVCVDFSSVIIGNMDTKKGMLC
jgi:hypothetical protein